MAGDRRWILIGDMYIATMASKVNGRRRHRAVERAFRAWVKLVVALRLVKVGWRACAVDGLHASLGIRQRVVNSGFCMASGGARWLVAFSHTNWVSDPQTFRISNHVPFYTFCSWSRDVGRLERGGYRDEFTPPSLDGRVVFQDVGSLVSERC